MKPVYIYIPGLLLFLASLFAPAYSPYGAADYTGADALNALLALRPGMLLDYGRAGDILAAAVVAVSGLNNVFVFASPLLFPLRRTFHRSRWFWAGTALCLACTVATVLYTWHAGFIRLRYGYYLWVVALALVYLSFHPAWQEKRHKVSGVRE